MAISQLSAQIPATVSFALMPILFVALHAFTLIRYDMLATNVRHFMTVSEATCPARGRSGKLLAAASERGIHSKSDRATGFAVAQSPVWIRSLGGDRCIPGHRAASGEINALRYQNEIVTNVQRVSLLVDLAMLFWFYNRRRRQRVADPDALGVVLRRWAICLWLPVIVTMVNLDWLNIPGPGNQTIGYGSGWGIAFMDKLKLSQPCREAAA